MELEAEAAKDNGGRKSAGDEDSPQGRKQKRGERKYEIFAQQKRVQSGPLGVAAQAHYVPF